MSEKKFTYAQVREHNEAADLWLIIDEKVYDVTKFLNEHPGGEEVLIDAGGKDATKEFNDVGHSEAAIEQLETYLVGEIVDSEKKSKSSSKKNVILGASSSAAIALGAYIIYKGYKYFKST
ncbi:cytochrome b5-like [Sitodiplosis mosellana]|uniref:cytochrome b5-like n=1 Tax=Sitodiplosis mosellana TaxID=263140 RepID=UPI0024437B09|nr:cytochrome b5-like [Sitodiplosis mosellana]